MATFSDSEKIKKWELNLCESINFEFKTFRSMNDDRIEKEEKIARDKRREAYNIAATTIGAMTACANAIGAVAAYFPSNLLGIRRQS